MLASLSLARLSAKNADNYHLMGHYLGQTGLFSRSRVPKSRNFSWLPRKELTLQWLIKRSPLSPAILSYAAIRD